ncbi:MAG: hypothetical protein R3Y53_07025 [Bacillota bacterium]
MEKWGRAVEKWGREEVRKEGKGCGEARKRERAVEKRERGKRCGEVRKREELWRSEWE